MARTSLLERIVDERVGHAFVGTFSVEVDRLAEEFAREAFADEAFRRTLRAMVRTRSREMLERLLAPRRARSGRARRPRARR